MKQGAYKEAASPALLRGVEQDWPLLAEAACLVRATADLACQKLPAARASGRKSPHRSHRAHTAGAESPSPTAARAVPVAPRAAPHQVPPGCRTAGDCSTSRACG